MKRVRPAAALGTAAVMVLAACTPGGQQNDGDEANDGDDSEVATDVAEMGEQSLVVWDQEVRGGQNEQMEQLNEAFMDAYPNIEIDRVPQSNDDLQQTLNLALTGSDAPDVAQVNNSRSQMGQYVADGLLRSLEPYAEAYDVSERFTDSVLQNTRYSTDGVTFGDGDIYGLPQVGEVVGVFYNTSKLEELDLEVPGTWQEFTEQLETAKEQDEVPLMLGNLDQWPAVHVFGPVQGAHVDASEIRALGFGNEGASWQSSENEAAAEELQEWVESDYFNNGFNGADYDSTWQDFADDEGVFLIGGSWLAADIEEVMGDDVGFFAPPPVEEDEAPVTTGATGIPFAITSSSDIPDVAGAYIDFITSDDAMEVLADTGNMPVIDTEEHLPEEGVQRDVYGAYDEVISNGELLPYLDWATPTMSDTIEQSLQAFMGGEQDVDTFLETLEDDYAAFLRNE